MYIKKVVIIIAVIIAVLLFLKYMFVWTLPFIIAWVTATLIQPAAKFLHKKLRLPHKVATVLVLIILFSLIGFLLFLIINRAIYELSSLSQTLMSNIDIFPKYIDNAFAWFARLVDGVPFFQENGVLDNIRTRLDTALADILTSVGTLIASKVPEIATSIITSLPIILLSVIIMIISSFYMSMDYTKINSFVMLQIPVKIRNVLIDIKNKFFEAIYKYLKAYAIIVLITYCELAAGFLIIGINYAFLLAGVVALVDILPILGSGTVLIPWGIINIINANYFEGFALLVLYAIITVVRQIIEPKILGKSIGIYPVVILISLYIGYNMFGFLGMFLIPICIMILKNLNDEGKIKIWKNPDKKD